MANRICKFPAIPAAGLCILVFAHCAAAGLTVTRVDLRNSCHNYTDADSDQTQTISNPLNHVAILDAGATNVDAVYQFSWDELTGYGSFRFAFEHYSTDLAFGMESLNNLDIQLDTPVRMRVTGSVEMNHAPSDTSSIAYHLGIRGDGQLLAGQYFSEGTDWANGVSSGSTEFDETIDLPAGIELEIENYIWSDSPSDWPGFFDAFGEFTITFSPACEEIAECLANEITAVESAIYAPATNNWAHFGVGVDLSGDVAIIGARYDNQQGPSRSGAAYIYRLLEGQWHQEAMLTASVPIADSQFGHFVSIDDDCAIVSRFSSPSGVLEDWAAFVFRKVGDAWPEEARLIGADTALEDSFGSDVSISGNTAIIGASRDNDNGTRSGSAYIFERIEGVWQQVAKLTAPDGAAEHRFGNHVSIDGDTAVVSAIGDVYVFRRIDGAWQIEAKLIPSNTTGVFGFSISLQGDSVIVGDVYDDAGGVLRGSAFLFRRTNDIWEEEAKFTASDATDNDWFGYSVSVDGDLAIVSSLFNDDSNSPNGTVYLFGRASPGCWNELLKVRGSDAHLADASFFGYSISLDNGRMMSSAWLGPHPLYPNVAGTVYMYDLSNPGQCDDSGLQINCPLLGDSNRDGAVDLDDIPGFVAEAMGQSDCRIGDFNANGITDGHDVGLFAAALLSS